ncbi:NAD(P)H-hydrate dehydratase [Geobacter sp. SVR]|uniref:NAD(P)H-hydrate dehydratase n=1 Tax=Geobacter sp. SVR TaxID=2495594 RepID=UPI00143F0441|nr:NAD(P)H-hydrate dehydratase [Geobacter sp. SVR]BCS54511.1 bifunctional NAD(P)H-hydrate repair enzyme [Geobacter sp. SVR]GCF87111.1 bifunctional NAD(P)H-hydrate repair enzyme [Geobacter sp. SVR]
MKAVTPRTMQEIDRRAIEDEGIPGLQLMENAGRSCVAAIMDESGLQGAGQAVVLAGKGNNGGDGYVIARLLHEQGWRVKVLVLAEQGQITGDAAANLIRLPLAMISFCPDESRLAQHGDELCRADLIMDALLGTGLNSTITGVYRTAVELVNSSGRPILSVDIPSGIHGTTGMIMGDAVRASLTVTFALPKLGLILFPGAEHVGKLVVADIRIPPHIIQAAPGFEILDAAAVRPLLRRRDRRAHKGSFGHCLIVAGSPGKTGAAAMSANSAVRTGSGLVSLTVAASLNPILEVKTTEAMTIPLPDSGSGHLDLSVRAEIEKLLPGRDAVALGPGLDRRPETALLVRSLVETITAPLVIDADGLNAVAEDVGVLLRKKSPSLVLTPHPGEMGRLLGASVPEIEANRIAVAQEFARTYGIYLILKGARTIIASPDGAIAINTSGNPGMASGGMGDVLTGILVSLLGQGYPAWDACRLGVFLHGYAGDMVADDKGEIGMNATDVQEMLPYACKRLFMQPLSDTAPKTLTQFIQ